MEKQKQNDDDGGQTLVEQQVADAEEAAVPGDSPAPPTTATATATATSSPSSSGEKTEEEIERRRKRKEAHRRHRRERELQKQILEAERLRINYLQDPRKRIGRDYEQWQAGQTVQTPEAQQKLTILRRIDDGHAGVVFKVRDEAGSMLALKVPRSESEKQFKKLHQEVAKNARMQSLGLPVAEITEEGGDYLVKRWIDGLRGDHWFIQWNEKGRPLDDLAWRRLCEMFDMLAAKNIYVQNLKDLNMIWDGQKWVVIDVGYFKAGLTPQQALGRYYETFDGRWNKPRYNRGRFMFLCPTIAALRGHSHPQHYIKRESARTAYQRGITGKSKTSTAEGDASGSGELLLPRIDTTNGGPMSPLLPGGKVGGLGASNGGSSEAINDIKRKQAEAAMAVLERANRKKKKKQRQAAAAASGGGSKESDAVDGAAATTTTTTATAVTTTVKDESGGEEKTKKRSAKDEEKEKKELKGKKEKELKEKKEKKEKELREKRDQKEKEKKEKEQKKKK